MLIDINKVIVNERIRKDFGNIEELADDIKENGLINPPVVTPDFELIAGERRLRALRYLGYPQIEVRVMSVQDALHQLKLEISENENRKDFSFSEKMRWAEELKKEYSKIAKQNQLSGLNNQSSFDQQKSNEKIDTNKQIAEDVGFGGKETYRKAQYIYNNANEEMIEQLDDGQLSINKAYNTLKQQIKEKEEELKVKQYENDKLKMQVEHEKSKKEVIREVEVVVDNTDYTLKNRLAEKEDEIRKLKNEVDYVKESLHIAKERAEIFENDSKEYRRIMDEMEDLTERKDMLSRQINAINDLMDMMHNIDDFLKTKLAPIKYSKSFFVIREDSCVKENIEETIQMVRNWCNEIEGYMFDNNNFVEII